MSTTVSNTLTYYLIQPYLLKDKSVTLPATGGVSVLKNFAIFTGLQACNSIKKRLQHRCFPLTIAKFLRTPILKNIC